MKTSSATRKAPHNGSEVVKAMYTAWRAELRPRKLQPARQNNSAATASQRMTPANKRTFTAAGVPYRAVVSWMSFQLPEAKAQDSSTRPRPFPASARLVRKTTLSQTAQKSRRRRFRRMTWFTASLLVQHQIDHPASSDMRPWRSAMVQDFWVVAASFLQGIGKDRQAVEGIVVVNPLSQGDQLGGSAGGGDVRRSKWVAEEVPQD